MASASKRFPTLVVRGALPAVCAGLMLGSANAAIISDTDQIGIPPFSNQAVRNLVLDLFNSDLGTLESVRLSVQMQNTIVTSNFFVAFCGGLSGISCPSTTTETVEATVGPSFSRGSLGYLAPAKVSQTFNCTVTENSPEDPGNPGGYLEACGDAVTASLNYDDTSISAASLAAFAQAGGGTFEIPVLFTDGSSNLSTTGSGFDGTRYATATVEYTYTESAVGVPEPGTLALLGVGLAGLAAARRRRQ